MLVLHEYYVLVDVFLELDFFLSKEFIEQHYACIVHQHSVNLYVLLFEHVLKLSA